MNTENNIGENHTGIFGYNRCISDREFHFVAFRLEYNYSKYDEEFHDENDMSLVKAYFDFATCARLSYFRTRIAPQMLVGPMSREAAGESVFRFGLHILTPGTFEAFASARDQVPHELQPFLEGLFSDVEIAFDSLQDGIDYINSPDLFVDQWDGAHEEFVLSNPA